MITKKALRHALRNWNPHSTSIDVGVGRPVLAWQTTYSVSLWATKNIVSGTAFGLFNRLRLGEARGRQSADRAAEKIRKWLIDIGNENKIRGAGR